MKFELNKKVSIFFALAVFAFAAFLPLYIRGVRPVDFIEKVAATHSEIKVFVSERPSSFDPLDFDYNKHHAVQSATHIKLVSHYTSDAIRPALASGWKSLDSDKIWRFKIRSDLHFADGLPILPKHVVLSLKRIVFLISRNSKSNEFVNALVGANGITSIQDPSFVAIREEGDEVVLNFNRPFPKLLEFLSFGLYAIVSPSMFNLVTGEWISPLSKSSGAGPYALRELGKDFILMERKKDYPSDLFHRNAADSILFFSDVGKINESDLANGAEDSEYFSGRLKFHSRGAFSVMYFQCFRWKDKSSPFHDLSFRRAFRSRVYEALLSRGIKVSRSFFPLAMKGIAEPMFEDGSPIDRNKFSNLEIRFRDSRTGKSRATDEVLNAFEEAISGAGAIPQAVSSMSFEEEFSNTDFSRKKFDLEVGFMGTGISVIDPEGDVRFMFSKEGVWLPDLNGEIHELLARDPLDVQQINQKLFDQAIIWPISKYSSGIWAKESLDFNSYNLLLPLGELQWIGTK